MGLKLTPGEHHMRSENFLWSHDTQGKYKNPCLPIKTPIYSVKYNNIKIETLPLASLITLTKAVSAPSLNRYICVQLCVPTLKYAGRHLW